MRPCRTSGGSVSVSGSLNRGCSRAEPREERRVRRVRSGFGLVRHMEDNLPALKKYQGGVTRVKVAPDPRSGAGSPHESAPTDTSLRHGPRRGPKATDPCDSAAKRHGISRSSSSQQSHPWGRSSVRGDGPHPASAEGRTVRLLAVCSATSSADQLLHQHFPAVATPPVRRDRSSERQTPGEGDPRRPGRAVSVGRELAPGRRSPRTRSVVREPIVAGSDELIGGLYPIRHPPVRSRCERHADAALPACAAPPRDA